MTDVIFVPTRLGPPCRYPCCHHGRCGRDPNGRIDCVTLDLSSEDSDGMDVLKAIAGRPLAGPIAVISGMDCRASSCRARFNAGSRRIDLADRRIFPRQLFSSPMISRWINVSYRAEQHETGVDSFEQAAQLEIARYDIIPIEELSEPVIVTAGLHYGLDHVVAVAHALGRAQSFDAIGSGLGFLACDDFLNRRRATVPA